MRFFDQKIILNSFRTTIKSKFTLIWIGIMTPVIIGIFFLFAFLNQQRIDNVGHSILAISLSVLITVLVWEIVNLNFLFSSSRELGIVNLEIRKGRTAKEIFFSRLLVNKIFSLGYILLMMIFFLIIFAIFNSRDLSLFWLFLTFIPTDLFLTAAFLLFMSMGRYKLTIALSSILVTLIGLTPFLQMMGSMIAESGGASTELMGRVYSANRVLSLAYDEDEGQEKTTSFTYQLLNETYQYDEIIKRQDGGDFPPDIPNYRDLQNNKVYREFIRNLALDGLFYDSAEILNEMWNVLPEFKMAVKPVQKFEVKEKIKNSLLYKINDKLAIGSHETDKRAALVKEYENSLYSDHQVTSAHYQSMIKNLSGLIQKINQQFPNDKNVVAFNQIVLEYAQGMLFNPDNNYVNRGFQVLTSADKENGENGIDNTSITYYDYLQRVADDYSWVGSHAYGLDYQENQKETFKHLSISPELRLWNEIAMQLLKNALNLNLEDLQRWTVDYHKFQSVAFFPWTAQYEAWFFSKPNFGFYDYYRLVSAKLVSFAWSWLESDPIYYNKIPTPDDDENWSGNHYGTINQLEKIAPTHLSDDHERNFKTFSALGYELAIAAISLGLMGIAFWIFFKKIKK